MNGKGDKLRDKIVGDFYLATDHWEHTEKILESMVGVCKDLYVEAMIHGLKHGREESQATIEGVGLWLETHGSSTGSEVSAGAFGDLRRILTGAD